MSRLALVVLSVGLAVLAVLSGIIRQTTPTRWMLATKTPYSSVLHNQPAPDPFPATCTPVHINLLARHGTRYPTNNHFLRMHHLAAQLAEFGLSSQQLALSINNTINFMANKPRAELTPLGAVEMKSLAFRLRQRFPPLFNLPLSAYRFQSSFKLRAVESAFWYLVGAFNESSADWQFSDSVEEKWADIGRIAAKYGLQHQDTDHLLRFFDQCPKYEEFDESEESDRELNEWLQSRPLADSLDGVKAAVCAADRGGSCPLATEDLPHLFSLCASAVLYLGDPTICSAIPRSAMQLIEYAEDLDKYWDAFGGVAINHKQSCLLVQAMADEMRPFLSPSAAAAAQSTVVRHVARFAHAETLLPLVSALRIVQTEDLQSEVYDEKRAFRTSLISPLGANLALVVLHCPAGDASGGDSMQVLTLLNEAPVRPFNHTSPLIPLPQFLRLLHRNQLTCDRDEFTSMCAVST